MIDQSFVNFLGMSAAFGIGWRSVEFINKSGPTTRALPRVLSIVVFGVSVFFSFCALAYDFDITGQACVMLIVFCLIALTENIEVMAAKAKKKRKPKMKS